MNKIIPPGGSGKDSRSQIKSGKKKARIGFLEALGDSGYENRTDPNYCYDILRNLINEDEPGEENSA